MCLPVDGPDYDSRLADKSQINNDAGFLYAVQYHGVGFVPGKSSLDANTAACSVCETKSKRNKILMIPGKLKCPQSWTVEYTGFIMTTFRMNYHYRSGSSI